MAVLLEASPLLASALAPALGAATTVVDTPAQLRRAVHDEDHDLVVVGPGADLAAALELAAAERVARPWVGVVLVRTRVDSGVLTEALRAGVREVVKADDLTGLADACRRSGELSRAVRGAPTEAAPARRGHLTAVYSPKGGVGTTTVAVNLAAALADGGRREVALVDLDLEGGDVALALQLDPVHTIADAAALGALDADAAASLVVHHDASGLDVLLAPVAPGGADGLPPSTTAALLGLLLQRYDHVVVDTPTALDERVLGAIDTADHVVLVTTPDLAAVKALRLAGEAMDLLAVPADRCSTVLNRAGARAGVDRADVEAASGRRVTAELPSHRAVAESLNRGTPLVLDAPRHPVSAAVRRFCAERLLPAPPVPSPRRGPLRALRPAATGAAS